MTDVKEIEEHDHHCYNTRKCERMKKEESEDESLGDFSEKFLREFMMIEFLKKSMS